MRILVTNDDGVYAPGLAALRALAAEIGEVMVVAPSVEQSAASHSITFTHMLAQPIMRIGGDDGFDAVAVDGSPADCVRLAVLKLMPHPPDLVLSGINAGANVGIHVFYSGTIGAAAEGAMLGIPGIAFSASTQDERPDFARVAALCRPVLRRLIDRPMRGGDLVSVNIPASSKRPAGVKVTRQSRAEMRDMYEEVATRGGATTYAIRGGKFDSPGSDTDVAALHDGYITVSPLKVDRTDHEQIDALRACDWDGALDGA